jgi:histidine ammonia-lyase
VIELTEQVAAAALLAAVQGVELRGGHDALSPAVLRTIRQVREQSAFLSEDRALDKELRAIVNGISERHWELY